MVTLELSTEEMDQAELREWAKEFSHAHRFAWAYKEENPAAVVCVASVRDKVHCYAYDPKRDIVVDATLEDFEGLPAGCWAGDEHPYVDDARVERYESYGSFLETYAGPDSPFEF